MKFGIIQCNKCHRAFGISLRFKKTTCPYCNNKLSIIPKKITQTSNSEKALASIISKINQQLEEQKELVDAKEAIQPMNFTKIKPELKNQNVTKNDTIYEDLDPFKRIAIKYKGNSESIQLIQKMITDLCHELGEFTDDDFKELFLACKIDLNKTDEYLSRLKEYSIIFEPRPGRYRLIED